jgi:hypothetical protein
LTTTYHSTDKYFYVFSENGFRVVFGGGVDKEYDDKSVWHLVDSNQYLTSMPLFLSRVSGKIVQAASPELDRHREWVKQKSATIWWMSSPSWEEVYVTLSVATVSFLVFI